MAQSVNFQSSDFGKMRLQVFLYANISEYQKKGTVIAELLTGIITIKTSA